MITTLYGFSSPIIFVSFSLIIILKVRSKMSLHFAYKHAFVSCVPKNIVLVVFVLSFRNKNCFMLPVSIESS